ncbi:MAG: hypothetical protein K8F57_02955, partial [Alphaproteobacteria bacterium]|nr:hypothetical protein [Alphaproteobacteria bacterium]
MLKGITACGFVAVLGFALVADAAPRKTDSKVAIEAPAPSPAHLAGPGAAATTTESAPAAGPTLVDTLPAPSRFASRGPGNFVLLPFQGILTDDVGTPLDGNVNLDLAIYNVASGGGALWSETRAGEPVTDGLVSFSLGASDSIPAALFDGSARWLGIRVNGDPE